MKAIAGLLVLVMLITVVAATGSRAQPLMASSVAFQQCLNQAAPSGDRCASVLALAAGAADFAAEFAGEHAMNQASNYGGDFGQGQDVGEPDPWVTAFAREFVKFVLVWVLDRALDRYFGGSLSTDLSAYTSPELFDAVR